MARYELVLRFDCDTPELATCIAHELYKCLRPYGDVAVTRNPNIWSMESDQTDDGFNLSYDTFHRAATTQDRDHAYRQIHPPADGRPTRI